MLSLRLEIVRIYRKYFEVVTSLYIQQRVAFKVELRRIESVYSYTRTVEDTDTHELSRL